MMIALYISRVQKLNPDRLSAFPEERQQKITGCRAEAERNRSYTGMLLLQHSFSNVIKSNGKAAVLPEISYGRYGKPYFKDYPEFHFSISHSGNAVICAVSGDEIGADIQEMVLLREGIAERFFMPEEILYLQEAGEKQRKELFFRLWTAKEAYIKYSGRGMNQPLNSFLVSQTQSSILDQDRFFPLWQHQFQWNEADYVVSICTKQPGAVEIIHFND